MGLIPPDFFENLLYFFIRWVDPQNLPAPVLFEGIFPFPTPWPPPADKPAVFFGRKGVDLRLDPQAAEYVPDVLLPDVVVLGNPPGGRPPKP
jgi:hypothetical protein